MPEQSLTYESVLELIREGARRFDKSLAKQRARFDREMRERYQKMQESAVEFDRKMKESAAEFDRRMQKAELQMERTSKEVGKLGNSIGRIIEHMLGERIIEKFQALGYGVAHPVVRNCCYINSKMGIVGEFDLTLVDTDVVILISVKTTLEIRDVRHHLEQIDEYRRHIDAVGFKHPTYAHLLPTTRFFGAVAGAVVEDAAMKFAHENGMYVITQSGDAVEIVPVPEGFKAKEW
jgi:hypothetical protein